MSEPVAITPYSLAARYLGTTERPGARDNHHISAWLADCGFDPDVHDEVPWCAAFVRHIAWLLGLPIPGLPARARSWLTVGAHIPLPYAQRGDVVVLSRGPAPQPGANVLDAPGHVGFFDALDVSVSGVSVLGGNQGDRVSLQSYPASRVLGVRRLAWP